MTRPRRILFYVQHLLGIGHLARAARIARAARAAGLDLVLVTGGVPVPGFPGDDLPRIYLPPVAAAAGFAGLLRADGTPADDAFLAARRDRLLAAFRDIAPDVVVTEAFPFGRRQMRFELLPLVEAIAAARPRPRLVASLRDILQENRKPGRDAETLALVQAHYDAVLVHGDPAFAQLDDTFPHAPAIAARTHYTGLVCGPPPPPPTERWDAIVSAGGGAVGGGIARAALGAAALLPRDWRWLVITGPNLPEAEAAALAAAAPPQVGLARFRPDFPSLLAGTGVSVSQAGYNTAGDLLRASCPAVLVPFAAGGETEQSVRAARLAALGLAQVVEEAALSRETLAEAIARARAAPRPPVTLRTDGAETTARLLAEA